MILARIAMENHRLLLGRVLERCSIATKELRSQEALESGKCMRGPLTQAACGDILGTFVEDALDRLIDDAWWALFDDGSECTEELACTAFRMVSAGASIC